MIHRHKGLWAGDIKGSPNCTIGRLQHFIGGESSFFYKYLSNSITETLAFPSQTPVKAENEKSKAGLKIPRDTFTPTDPPGSKNPAGAPRQVAKHKLLVFCKGGPAVLRAALL